MFREWMVPPSPKKLCTGYLKIAGNMEDLRKHEKKAYKSNECQGFNREPME